MKLLTKTLRDTLPPLYATEKIQDPIVQCKFFDPCGSFTWYILEFDPAEEIFFSMVFSSLCPEGELGYVSLQELESIRGPLGLGIERDLYFSPCKLSECKSKHQ